MVSEIKVRVSNVEYMDGTINNNPTDYYTFNREAQNKGKDNLILMLLLITLLVSTILA